jgi:NNP family nitrate/nitrite transporter-like MFS transporter
MTLMTAPAIDPVGQKATRIDLFSLATPQMRAFHLTWIAFFVCFFAWFAAAPLMPLIKTTFGLTKDQIENINIAAVSVTIFVRLIIGPLCDKFGPRRAYTWLLLVGAIPVFGLAFAQNYAMFLFFRLCIGAIGASFVISQYHTSVMFAENVVGTANATVGGWGNAGAGAAQSLMALIATAAVSLGVEHQFGWRVALFVPGIAMWLMAFLYARFTQDTPRGDILDLRKAGVDVELGKKGGLAIFAQAARNYRVWMLACAYGGCFGVELYIHNVAASYYVDRYGLSLVNAGLAAGIFGGLALFARALGGIASDTVARSQGVSGRTILLAGLLFCEGVGLIIFGHAPSAALAIIAMTGFGLFTHMSAGAVYAIMPMVDRKALGGVCGLIGAGGNVGGVLAGFLNKGIGSTQGTIVALGYCVIGAAVCAAAVRFSPAQRAAEKTLIDRAIALRDAVSASASGRPGQVA